MKPSPVLLGLAGLVVLMLAGSTMPTGSGKKTKVPAQFDLVKALAAKWGRKFTVPLPLILMIAEIESSFRPGLYNLNERAMKLGGAWGVVAMTLQTGVGKVTQIRSNPKLAADPEIAVTLSKWNPAATVASVKAAIAAKNAAECQRLAQPLLDPDVCLLLGVYMLSGLWHKYKDYVKVAAAYHSGSVPVDAAIKAGVAVTDKLGPAGKEYVARATKLWPTYQVYA